MLTAMQQISLQMTSFNTPIGIINSTYQPLSFTPVTGEGPFQSSPTDIRVNVLWFASLIFSLMAASFGILIKQWLREYLAIVNKSPQARSRIRHSRYPELQRWLVLEIAAVLPLLQQLSLALFFIGLCYFTNSIHESIGWTSLPLIAGWAFCVTTVTVTPLFFPRCPYKTTLLGQLLVSTHLWVARSLSQLRKNKNDGWTLGEYESLREGGKPQLDEYIRRNDEQEIIACEDADLDILAEVDALQSNDELLGTVIFDSLQQIHNLYHRDGVGFVMRLLRHRLPSHVSPIQAVVPTSVDLRVLSQTGYNAIIDILMHVMTAQDANIAFENRAGLQAFHILFSPSRFPFTVSGTKYFKAMIEDARTRQKLAERLIRGCTVDFRADEQRLNCMHLLDSISRMLDLLDVDLGIAIEFFEETLDAWFRRVSDLPLIKFTVTGNLDIWSWETDRSWPFGVMEHFSTIVARAMARTSTLSQAYAFPEYTGVQARSCKSPEKKVSNALFGMYNLMAAKGSTSYISPLRRVVVGCLSTKEYTLTLLNTVRRVDLPTLMRCYRQSHEGTCFLEEEHAVPCKGIEKLIEGLNQLSHTTDTKPVDFDYALRLLCVCVNLVTSSTCGKYISQWHVVFKTLVDITYRSLLAIYRSEFASKFDMDTMVYYMLKVTRSRSHLRNEWSSVASHCLSYIQSFDSLQYQQRRGHHILGEGADWWTKLTVEDCAYPNELVEILATIYYTSVSIPIYDENWWRVQRLGIRERVDSARTVILDSRLEGIDPHRH
jgi:hypothetical protein